MQVLVRMADLDDEAEWESGQNLTIFCAQVPCSHILMPIMEPLSIAASVVGILSVTATLATGLTELIAKAKDVPESIRSLVTELSNVRACLAQLQPFLQDSERRLTSRSAMISLEQVLTINTSYVLTLSELEKFVDSFKRHRALSRLDKLRLIKNESRINRILLRLQASKSSLNLILVVLT